MMDSGKKKQMTNAAVLASQISAPTRLACRGDLTAFLMELSASVGADNYMLLALVHDQTRLNARIVASNWIFDAIELIGQRVIAALAQEPFNTAPGTRPRALVAAQAPATGELISGEDARMLTVLGHAELYSLRLNVGRQRLHLLFSASEAERIDPTALAFAQMKCCYALSQIPQLLAEAATQDPLSDRERECLFWVAEGKTTDEIAVILGVSSNTVNSYITHAIQKFSASNRSMAIATAIRSGIL